MTGNAVVWIFVSIGVLLLLLLLLLGISQWFWRKGDACVVLRVERDAETGAVIEIVDAACEEGLPHTTDARTIRMTEAVWASERRSNVLTHERVHLDQKAHERDWEAFYERAWEYTLSVTPPPSLVLSHRLRPNPDTAAKPWALWRSRWLFFPEAVLGNRLKDAPVRVWDTQEAVECAPPPEWNAFFCGSRGCPHQYEHPHEISAEMITGGSDSEAATRLFTWRNSIH